MTKILRYLLIAMLPFVFAACDKDDDKDDPKGSDANIVGTWTGTYTYDDGYDSTSQLWSMDFKSNGNFTWKYWDDDERDFGYCKGYYEYDSDIEILYLYITEDEDERYDEPEMEYFGCKISGKNMTLTAGGDRITLKKK
ncbi:MAG: hypothetical protein K2L96_06420 [Muribaculaceae bacterium]|nr:hypothetical protein [Muribaculaceae bacterium]